MNDEPPLIDTNILVYAFDETEPEKKAKCKKIVEKILRGETKAIVSNQILAEFYNALTKKIEKPIESEKALKIVQSFLRAGNIAKIDYTSKTVEKAIKKTMGHKAHFWDSLIAETMLENQVFEILTENEKDFSKIGQIKAVNPMKN